MNDEMAILDKVHDRVTDHRSGDMGTPVLRVDEGLPSGYKTNWQERLSNALGTQIADVPIAFMLQLVNSVGITEAGKARTVDYIIASICEIDPQNSIEAMLAAQMVSVHSQSMEMMRLACQCTFSDTCRKYLGLATQLMRLYTYQAETFRKLRSNGSQQIRVEHVNISGGQNVVGTVTQLRDKGVDK